MAHSFQLIPKSSCMKKNNKDRGQNQSGGITQKQDKNAGSGAFNQGSEQDPDFDKGTKVSDEEKLTGRSASPGKEKENKDENIGKNNAKRPE
jgi:hypothetical protein